MSTDTKVYLYDCVWNWNLYYLTLALRKPWLLYNLDFCIILTPVWPWVLYELDLCLTLTLSPQVSIIPRTSSALGFAQYLPSDNKLHSKEEVRVEGVTGQDVYWVWLGRMRVLGGGLHCGTVGGHVGRGNHVSISGIMFMINSCV